MLFKVFDTLSLLGKLAKLAIFLFVSPLAIENIVNDYPNLSYFQWFVFWTLILVAVNSPNMFQSFTEEIRKSIKRISK